MFFSRVSRRFSSILISKAASHGDKKAIIDRKEGTEWSYSQLLRKGKELSHLISKEDGRALIMTEAGAGYVTSCFAAWMSNKCTVPLCNSHTVNEMLYYAEDSRSSVLLHDNDNIAKATSLQGHFPRLKLINIDSVSDTISSDGSVPKLPPPSSPAVIIYTSGTTGNPKGVVHTHASVQNQIEVLIDTWKWSKSDKIISCLPLHHVHGMVNVVFCGLYAGAEIQFCSASSGELLPLLAGGCGANVFMAVPSVYAKLLEYVENEKISMQKGTFDGYRLMVSGSMALPPPIHHAWKQLTGVILLERYGMTETGMVLSQQVPSKNDEITSGNVGIPLPTVSVKLAPTLEEIPGYSKVGELLVKSPSVFQRYWRREDATKEAFDEEGYFYTGDFAGVTEDGIWSILGRLSVDVLKSSGYKLSALEIESVLLSSPLVSEAAVVGIPDPTYGQVVGAVLSLKNGAALDDVKAYCSDNLAKYKIPRRYHIVEAIPRNAMGKINKKELVKVFDF
eukprot:TRINITY_DN19306_c0_g1_i1.p1 TRINITY_DN19306_c0_g1~~TRINITY_DN19306_c0_g1_i1.p1  ORF type:complete len:526 (+),score=87.98 TRINITY_DN19306_c0_g1_i1:61-1578(+)